jgi:hypothetical protein
MSPRELGVGMFTGWAREQLGRADWHAMHIRRCGKETAPTCPPLQDSTEQSDCPPPTGTRRDTVECEECIHGSLSVRDCCGRRLPGKRQKRRKTRLRKLDVEMRGVLGWETEDGGWRANRLGMVVNRRTCAFSRGGLFGTGTDHIGLLAVPMSNLLLRLFCVSRPIRFPCGGL